MPGVMIYVQHLLGIGHLMRARAVAEAIAVAGFEVQLVTGGMPIGAHTPPGVDVVQLPPIRVADASFTPLLDAEGAPIDEAYRNRRRDLLLAAYDRAAPVAVLCEAFPFGRRALRFELLPLMERIHATRARPLVVSSVREILKLQQKPERERETLEWADRWFDAIFVHGDRRFIGFEHSFPLAAQLAPALHYTGFVVPADRPAGAGAGVGPRREVVVSAGGGAVGLELLATALAAQSHSRFGQMTWRFLAGPNIGAAGLARLLREAGPNAIVERGRPDFAALLRQAFVSVSQAGYNTVLDVVQSGARPVLVPFADNAETEQRTRGRRLRELGLAVVIDDLAPTPAALARAVDEAGTRDDWGRWDFATDGAQRSAALLRTMLDAPAARRAGVTR